MKKTSEEVKKMIIEHLKKQEITPQELFELVFILWPKREVIMDKNGNFEIYDE